MNEANELLARALVLIALENSDNEKIKRIEHELTLLKKLVGDYCSNNSNNTR